eukprot:s1293_g19.t1
MRWSDYSNIWPKWLNWAEVQLPFEEVSVGFPAEMLDYPGGPDAFLKPPLCMLDDQYWWLSDHSCGCRCPAWRPQCWPCPTAFCLSLRQGCVILRATLKHPLPPAGLSQMVPRLLHSLAAGFAFATDDEVLAHYGTFEAPSFADTSFAAVKEHLLQGRPFVVNDGARGLPMAAWDCDFVSREFPHSRIRQEGGMSCSKPNKERNGIKMNSNWQSNVKRYPGSEKYPPGAPRIRPFYWDIAKAYQEERERMLVTGIRGKKWGKEPGKVVQQIVRSSKVPYWLPQQSSIDAWLTTAWVPPPVPHPDGYFDGEVYGALNDERRSEWQPTFELTAPNGSAVVVYPGMVHDWSIGGGWKVLYKIGGRGNWVKSNE